MSTPVSECEGHWGVSKGRKDISKRKSRERGGQEVNPEQKLEASNGAVGYECPVQKQRCW